MLHTSATLSFPLFFPLFSPPVLQLLCPLPACCIPALPSDREGWLGVRVCTCVFQACTSSNVHCACVWGCTCLSFFCLHVYILRWCVQKRHTCRESIRQCSQSNQQRADSTELSCIPNKAVLLHPYTHKGFDPLSHAVILVKGASCQMKRTGSSLWILLRLNKDCTLQWLN